MRLVASCGRHGDLSTADHLFLESGYYEATGYMFICPKMHNRYTCFVRLISITELHFYQLIKRISSVD